MVTLHLLNDSLWPEIFSKQNIDIDGVAIPKGVSSIEYNPYYDKRKIKDWNIANKFCKVVKDSKKSEEYNEEITKLLTAPENSAGSIVYNNLIKENDLENKYEFINNHDKIKIIHLIPDNPKTHKFGIIGFKDSKVLDDLELRPYINWEKIWEKEVFNRVDIIAEKIGWNLKLAYNKAPDLEVW